LLFLGSLVHPYAYSQIHCRKPQHSATIVLCQGSAGRPQVVLVSPRHGIHVHMLVTATRMAQSSFYSPLRGTNVTVQARSGARLEARRSAPLVVACMHAICPWNGNRKVTLVFLLPLCEFDCSWTQVWILHHNKKPGAALGIRC
jgi:hypothetical protein